MSKYDDITKVLIADDQEINSLLAETLFRSILPDASFLIASSGEEAAEAAKEYKPQLIFTDIRMPGGMDGYELASLIRKMDFGFRPFIVALSADMGQDNTQKRKDVGIDFYVSKPLKRIEIVNVLERYYSLTLDEEHDLTEIHLSTPRFNIESLKERLASNIDIIDIVLESARESVMNLNNELQALKESWEEYQPEPRLEAIREYTHKLNGVALTVGFDTLSVLSREFHNIPSDNVPKQKRFLDLTLKEIEAILSMDMSDLS